MELTRDELRRLLDYEPVTGVFRWRVTRSKAISGAIAGTTDDRGRVRIKIQGRLHLAHRLAWLYVHGVWPSDEIDHRNPNKPSNGIVALRPATRQQNAANRRKFKNNTSGFKGVSWNGRRWSAYIKINGRSINLGARDDPEEAHKLYVAAATRAWGEFARAE